MTKAQTQDALDPLHELTELFITYTPKLALFVAVVLAGLLLSWIARSSTRWLIKRSGLEALGERFGIAKLLYAIGARDGLAELLATLVWISGLLLTFAGAAELIGLTAVAAGVAIVMAFLPRLLAAGLVLLVGLSAAGVLRSLITRIGTGGALESPDVVATGLYYVVITISVVMAADQAGLETKLVHQLVVTACAICLAAVGLAFALGSGCVFRNLVAGHYLRRAARPGDTVEFGEVSGVLLRHAGVSVVVQTDEGEVLVPCQSLLDSVIGVTPVVREASVVAAPTPTEPAAPPTRA